MIDLGLKPEVVDAIFFDCLYRDDETLDGAVPAEGIMGMVGFHPLRLELHRDDVLGLLRQFSEQSDDSDGDQTVDKLFMLGMALGEVHYMVVPA